MPKDKRIVVIGAGFTGLAAAYEIARCGIGVTVLEKDDQIGGLAGSFKINGHPLEKFYHHFFKNDEYVIRLAGELGLDDRLLQRCTKTGICLNNRIFRLSTPLDVLRFSPLTLLNRIRLGSLVPKARLVKNWKQLESITAEQWLLKLSGPQVYRLIWQPLLRGKFGPYASQISAAWLWNKIALRGASRSRTAEEMLTYYRGGFAAFAQVIANEIVSAGGVIRTGLCAKGLLVRDGRIKAVQTPDGTIEADVVIATAALPIIADLLAPHLSGRYINGLRQIKYLANVCLVLELSRRLSDIYWLNIADGDFPFVGLIEHTNFQPPEIYGDRHIVYLSKYLPETAELYRMSKERIFEFSLPYIERMFPEFDRSYIRRYHFWKARYAQPIVVRNYSRLIPSDETPIEGFYIATMAQIYPEDRGVNYAIRQGRHIGRLVAG